MTHTFTQEEDYETTIEADNADDAVNLAKDEARRNKDEDHYEAEYEHTDIEGHEIEVIKGEDKAVPYRCDGTIDMFNRA